MMGPKSTSTPKRLLAFAGAFFLGAAGAAPPVVVPAPPVDVVLDGSAPELGAGACVPDFDAADDEDEDEDEDEEAREDEEPGSGANGLRALPPCCLEAPLTSAAAPLEVPAVAAISEAPAPVEAPARVEEEAVSGKTGAVAPPPPPSTA